MLLAENINFEEAILINCTGKFCYRHGNFQNTEAATEGFLKNLTKLISKRLCQSLSQRPDARGLQFIKKETPTQVLFCELCEIFKSNFFYKRLFLKI